MKIYTGAPADARHYVEADRGRADDYYLAEGTGVAQRFTVDGDGHVIELAALGGDSYEAWVAGVDPDTGQPRGRLRQDERAVRFVEVVVNGPKSWSLAAELHPDIAAVYEAAQDRAAGQIVGWLGQHATVRVGPRGSQVAVPVARLEAVTVRHYTSRAGDPHRHLHLQVNARVFAAGQWRGLHTVGVRDSLTAVNGIGHAAVATDPQFRAALAIHGFTLDSSGEITQLAPFVGAFSRRAAQIAANLDRYGTDWAATHPGQTPGPVLRRAWDARAWADGRPDKIIPEPGEDLNGRWLSELAELGYRDRDNPVDLNPTPVGHLDRDRAVGVVLARLGAARSAWNAADVRGEVEQLLAREQIVIEAAVRGELAEDLTARTVSQCVPFVGRDPVPEHIRALTSRPVLQVEDDLVGRLAARGTDPGTPVDPARAAALVAHAMRVTGRRLDPGQARVVAALAGNRSLLVIEGAAGVGKTTTLATARAALATQGHALLVVTPTLKAATLARSEVGGRAGSAAWLVYQHGWRWDRHGAWTRLAVGEVDPVTGRTYAGPDEKATLQQGDLVVVDEAGMLDQDTARALLTIADEHGTRVALVGDRHQLAAIGRGGVLELAHRWADPEACVSLEVVHRFTRQQVSADGRSITVPDSEYAALTIAMRDGADPGAVFDTLHARGQIRIHLDDAQLRQLIAAAVADADRTGDQSGTAVSVVADTREQVAQLNDTIRNSLIAAGLIDDRHAITTRVGERIGIGDRVATRRNNRALDVANRDTWTVTGIGRHGDLTVTNDQAGDRRLPAGYVDRYVELAYATTIHGAQGDTSSGGHLVLGEQTGAASAYVGMTRGRHANTAHLVADSIDDARVQWIAVFGRDRADLGPTHARRLARTEAARYATGRPLPQILADLHDAWDAEARCTEQLERAIAVRDQLAEIITLRRAQAAQLASVAERYENTKHADADARAQADRSEAVITDRTAQLHAALTARWNAEREAAREHARVVLAGPGRLGFKLPAVNRAADQLANWSMNWQLVLPDMPTGTRQIAYYADRYIHEPDLHAAFDRYARSQAELARPEHRKLLAAVESAGREREQAFRVLSDTRATQRDQLFRHGRLAYLDNPSAWLEQLDHDITAIRPERTTTQACIAQLSAEPAIGSRPPGFLAAERQSWQSSRDAQREATQRAAATRAALDAEVAAQERRHQTEHAPYHSPQPEHGPSIGR